MAAEIFGGLWANSLAILTDAAHMFSDLAGFGISILSIWIGTLPSSEKYTFGYKRAEIIGALVSVLLIWALTIALVYEAVMRTLYEEDVDGFIMLITA